MLYKKPSEVSIAIHVSSPLLYLKKCLKSIKRFTRNNIYELIFLIPEGIDKETKEFVADYPDAKICSVSDAVNRGKLYNQALNVSRTEFIVLVDDDIVVTKKWLDGLKNVIDKNPEIAVVGSAILHPITNKILHLGIDLGEDFIPLFPHREEFLSKLPENISSLGTSDRCMMLSKSLVEKAGGFSEDYVGEYEDLALCLRIQSMGHRVCTSPKSIVYHHELEKSYQLRYKFHNIKLLRENINRIEGMIKTNGPLVSCLSIVHNDERFLMGMIDSIINQTYRNWELILVDDASTDNSPMILEWYQKAFPEKIKILHRDVYNRGEAWIQAYKEARGEYIHITSSDDVFYSDKLRSQIVLLTQEQKLGAVFTDAATIDESGNFQNYHYGFIPPDHLLPSELLKSWPAFFPSIVFNRKAIESSGGWLDPYYSSCQDLELCQRIAMHYQYGLIPIPLMNYRLHEKSLGRLLADTTKSHLNKLITNFCRNRKVEEIFPFMVNTSDENLLLFYNQLERIVTPPSFTTWGYAVREVIKKVNDLLEIHPETLELAIAQTRLYISLSTYYHQKGDLAFFQKYLSKAIELHALSLKEINRDMAQKFFLYAQGAAYETNNSQKAREDIFFSIRLNKRIALNTVAFKIVLRSFLDKKHIEWIRMIKNWWRDIYSCRSIDIL